MPEQVFVVKTVNFNHDLRVIPRQTIDSDVLKKNINTPQFARLERRAKTRAEEVKVKTKKQQNIAANANIEAEKAPPDTEKATPKKLKIMLKKPNILLKKQRSYYWKPKRILKKLYGKFKLKSKQDKAILKKHKKTAKKTK